MSDAIKVAVRLRPLLPKELAEKRAPIWEREGRDKLVSLDAEKRGRAPQRFAFDRVFGMNDTNAEVYNELVEPLVLSAVAGFNVTVFAYGQTASGKTHTMLGGPNEPGVIHKAIESIFNTIENTPEREYLVRVAYMEIYNENISDLLANPKDRKNLKVSDVGGDVIIQNLQEQPVITKEQILGLMAQGHKQRHVGSTNMNEHSSRSHAIFRILIESRIRDCQEYEEAADGAVQVSHLNLVDLAGSEKASQTGATGDRFKEGCAINASLLSLSLVIKKLSEGDKFVSFRDSKLTHILRNSLGGNAKTAVICAVTPVVFEETLSTLNFASRAKSVTNDPHVNEVLTDQAQLKRYALVIRTLEKQLQQSGGATVEDMKRLLDEKESKIRELKEQLIVSSHVTDEPVKVELLRQARRMTWGGPGLRAALSSQASKPHRFLNSCSSVAQYNAEEAIDSSFVDASVALSALREEDDEEVATTVVSACSCRQADLPGKSAITVEFGVQTDLETPTVCGPSTPVPVLRRRLTSLQETVKKQAVEYEELAEFTRLEKTLEVGTVHSSDREVAELTAELERTRQTVNDTNGLLLETQKKLSLSEDLVKSLSQQFREVEVKRQETESTVERLQPLVSENQNLRKILSEQQSRLNLLENEKLDWETVLQINADAHKKKETELKQLLQEAWNAAGVDPEFYSRAIAMEKQIIELKEELLQCRAETESTRAAAEASNELAIRRFSELESTLSTQQAQLDIRESEIIDLRSQLDKAAINATSTPVQACSLANELRLASEGDHVTAMEESLMEDFTVTVPSKPFLKRKTSSMTPQELLSQTLASLNASIFADSPMVKKHKLSDVEENVEQDREEARAELEGLRHQLLLLQEALIEISNADHSKSLSPPNESDETFSEDVHHCRLEQVVIEKEMLAEAKEELEKRVNELEGQLEELSKTTQDLKVLKAELRSKDALVLELDELTMNLREELESVRSQIPMEATATDFKLEDEAANAKLDQILQENEAYQKIISTKEEEWTHEKRGLEEILENLKASLEKGVQETAHLETNELQALRAKNAAYQNEMAVLQQEILSLKAEIGNLRSEIDALTSRDLHRRRLEDSCVNCGNLLQRISEREAELGDIQARTALRMAELQNIVTGATNAREKLTNEMEGKIQLVDDLSLKMAELESSKNKQILSLEDELGQAQDRYTKAMEERQRALDEVDQYAQLLQAQLENKMLLESTMETVETVAVEPLPPMDHELSQLEAEHLEAAVISRRSSLDVAQREQKLGEQPEKEKLLSNLNEIESLKAEQITSQEQELAEVEWAQSEIVEARQRALDEALERVQQLEVQLVEQAKQLEKAQSNMAELESSKAQEIGRLDEELSSLKSFYSETKEAALEACQRALAEAMERVQQLEAQLLEKEKQLNQALLNVAELESSKVQEVGLLEEELSCLKSVSAASEQESQRALKEALESVHHLQDQLEEREKRLHAMQLCMDELESAKVEEFEALRSEAKLDVARAREQAELGLTQARAKNEQLEGELQKLAKEFQDCKAKFDEMETTAAEKVGSLEKQLLEANLSQSRRNQEWQRAIDDETKRRQALEDKLHMKEALEKDLAGKMAEAEVLKEKVASKDRDLQELQLLRGQILILKSTLLTKAKEWEQQVENLSQLTSDFERRLGDKENDISSLRMQCQGAAGWQAELRLKEGIITQLEKELDELRPLRQAKQELEEDLEDWQKKFDDLGDLFDMRNERYEMACEDLMKAEEEKKALRQKVEAGIAASKDLAVAQEKVQRLLEQINGLTTEKDSLTLALAAKEAELQRAKATCQELEKASAMTTARPSESENCEKLRTEMSSLKMEICRLNGLIAMKELQIQNDDKPYQLRCNELQVETDRQKKQIKELKEEVRLLSSRQAQEENTVALLVTKRVTKDVAVGTDEKTYGCGWCIRLPDVEKQLKKCKEEFESLQDDYDFVGNINEMYYVKMTKYRSLYYELKGEPEPPLPVVSREDMRAKGSAPLKASGPAAPQVLPQGHPILAANRYPTRTRTDQSKERVSESRINTASGASSTTVRPPESKPTVSDEASADTELYQMKAFTTSRSTHASLFDKNGLMKDSKDAGWKARFADFDFLGKEEKKSQQPALRKGVMPFSLSERATAKEEMENRPPTNKKLF